MSRTAGTWETGPPEADPDRSFRTGEERYRMIVDAVDQLIWVVGADGTSVEYFNRRWVSYLGSIPTTSPGFDWADLVHRDDLQSVLLVMAAGPATGAMFQAEFRIRRYDGTYRWHLARVSPLLDDDGDITGWLGGATDIDDRRRGEESIRFLAEISASLASAQESRAVIGRIAHLAVPRFADYCAVALLDENGTIGRTEIAHGDPETEAEIHRYVHDHPLRLDAPFGIAAVIRTGEPQFIPYIAPGAPEPDEGDQRRIMRAFRLHSYIAVPLTARGRVLGAISFTFAESIRAYNEHDFALAKEIARRVSLVLENVRLFEELRESEGRFRTIIETSPDVIYTIALDGTLASLSPAFETLTGWSSETWLGRHFAPIVHPEDLPTALERFHAVLSGRTLPPFQIRILTRSGTYLTAEFRTRPYMQEGAIIGAIGVAQDITERVLAEKSLRESERRLRRLLDSNTFGVVFGRLEGEIISANDYFLRMTGYTPDDLLSGSIHWETLTPPEYRATDRLALDKLRATGVCSPYEKEYVRKDGSRVPVLMGAAVLDEPYEEGEEIAAFLLDLTELHQVLEELRESEDLLAEAQRMGRIGSWDWEVSADRITWSEEMYTIYGVDRSTFSPTLDGFISLIHPDDRDRVGGIVGNSYRTGEPFHYHHRIIRPDGEIRVLRAHGKVIRNAEGTVVRMRGSGQDVTEARKAEEEITRLNEDLEARVVERTAQLEASNKELEAFAYSVSHDLRAPLRSIDGFCKILLDDYGPGLDDEGREYLDRARRASQRLGQLIDDLLNLSRVTRSEMRFEEVDLSWIAERIAQELRQTEPERTVRWKIAPRIVARGDARLLHLVMQNLLGNAWKFTARNPDAVISFGEEIRDGRRTMFVRDNGVGFSMAYVDKLFHSFQRLHSPAEFPGSGIGLATVARIIRRHGGIVSAEAAPGKGATFSFTL